jgi:hypothetical protein
LTTPNRFGGAVPVTGEKLFSNILGEATRKTELKKLVPEDAKEATGHGVKAKRSRSGAVSFDLMEAEVSNASLQ